MAIEKRFTHRIDIRATDVRLIGSVVQYDHFSNVVVCRLVDGIDEVDISGADFVTVTYKLNGNYLCMDALGARVNITSYEGGEITIILPDGAIRAPGDVYATVEVYEDETRMTSGKFAFRVVPDMSVDHGDNVELEDGFPILQEIATAESTRVSAETARARAETAREEAEAARVETESERATAEADRAYAETSRETAESNRASSEVEREGRFSDFMEEAQEGITDLWDAYAAYNPSITVAESTSSTYKLEVKYTDADTGTEVDYITPNLKGAKGESGAGTGDMLASDYDADGDFVVDNAMALNGYADTAFVKERSKITNNDIDALFV